MALKGMTVTAASIRMKPNSDDRVNILMKTMNYKGIKTFKDFGEKIDRVDKIDNFRTSGLVNV